MTEPTAETGGTQFKVAIYRRFRWANVVKRRNLPWAWDISRGRGGDILEKGSAPWRWWARGAAKRCARWWARELDSSSGEMWTYEADPK